MTNHSAKRSKAPWIILGVVLGLFLILGVGCMAVLGSAGSVLSSAPSTTGPGPQAPALSSGPLTTFGEGKYEVGKKILAGRYSTEGGDNCYFARLRDDSGKITSVIVNDISSGPNTVTVKAGEYFQVRGNCTWTKS
jgi:hypothetical protein